MTASSPSTSPPESPPHHLRAPRKPVPPGPIAPLNITRSYPSPPKPTVALQNLPAGAASSTSPLSSPSYIEQLVARVDAKALHLYDLYKPETKRECLTRYVFPAMPTPDTPPAPLSGPDMALALDQLHARSKRDRQRNGGAPTHIRVQYHSGLHGLLLSTVRRVARRPEFIPPYTHDEERMMEWYTMSVAEWRATCAELHAARTTRPTSEAQGCNDGFTTLVEPINDFLADKFNFEPCHRPMFTTGWVWPPPKEASGSTDWVAYSSDTPQAILKWKQDVSDEDMGAVAAAAIGPVRSWPIDMYPGFSIHLEGERVVNDGGIGGNAVSACLLAWSDSHHYGTRWTVVFNGRTALVFFLAKPDQLFVSELVMHDAGRDAEDLTVAVIMFALCVLDPAERPTCSMSDQVLRFYPRPAVYNKRLPPIPPDALASPSADALADAPDDAEEAKGVAGTPGWSSRIPRPIRRR